MTKRKIRGESADYQMAKALDDMETFHKFREEILPVLRSALTSGMAAEDIYSKFQAYAAARSVTIAATEVDSAKALSAIKDILDRTQGKAKERSEVTHRLANAPEEQLDSLIHSKLAATKSKDDSSED